MPSMFLETIRFESNFFGNKFLGKQIMSMLSFFKYTLFGLIFLN